MSKETEALQAEIDRLSAQIKEIYQAQVESFYFSPAAQNDWSRVDSIPARGNSAATVQSIVENAHALDFDQRLNTSSYVNVSFEPEEEAVALMGLGVNLADQTVYPESYKIHDRVVNMLARLWHCPEPDDFKETETFAGAGTVGSTEACLLAGLALKFRWREWLANRNDLSDSEVLGIKPNIVISTCFQAAWEKLFKYMDIEPRLIEPSMGTFKIDPERVRDAIDEHTIAVVCIMGNHYGGQYDPVWEVDRVVSEVNAEKGFQVGIHVDAASGGFIAPFQQNLPAWDFRLSNVLSISSSGHKYGESSCGTGWLVWRKREGLSEHVAISVTYLGGRSESYTLNFSRPATGVYVQYFKLLRFGLYGYQQCCENMMANAQFLRRGLAEMTYEGQPRFVILDDGEEDCLPVVTAMLNPESGLAYDDIDLQHVLSQHHWYVSGYRMGFEHPSTGETAALFSDARADQTMFRIVVKNNLTRDMARNLLESFEAAFDFLDSVDFSSLHSLDTRKLRHKDQRVMSRHC